MVPDKRAKIILVIYSFVFALAAMLTASCYRQFADKWHFLDYTFTILTPLHILVFAASFVSCFLGSNIINTKLSSQHGFRSFDKHRAPRIGIISFLLNMVIWGIMFLTYYPGVAMNDTVNCFMEEKSDMLPIVFWFVVRRTFQALVSFTSDSILSYAIITFVQMAFFSLVAAHFCAWLCKKVAPKSIVILSVLFFCAMPIIANYSIALLKDTWFSIGILLLLPSLYDFLFMTSANSNKLGHVENLICIFASFFLVWTSRSNVKFVVIIVALAIFIRAARSKSITIRTIILVPFIITIALVEILLRNYYWSDVERASMREASSVAFAQIAYTYARGGEFSDEEKEVFENILPEEEWAENACFSFVDKVKFNADFNLVYLDSHKEEFVKAWWNTFKRNPGLFLEAYLFHSTGFWNLACWKVVCWDQSQSSFFSIVGNTGYDSPWGQYILGIGLYNLPMVNDRLYQKFNGLYWVIVNGCILFSGGGLFFLELLCGTLLATQKKKTEMLCMLPIFLTWLSMMLASPGSLIYRYVFYMLISLPFCVSVLFINASSSELNG